MKDSIKFLAAVLMSVTCLFNNVSNTAYAAPTEVEQVYVVSRNGANYIVVKTQQPEVEIYQVEHNGTQTKLDLTAAYTSSTYHTTAYAHTELTNNKAYTYLVKTVDTHGVASSGETVVGVPSETSDGSIYPYGWTASSSTGGENDTYGLVAIENGVGIDGSAGMRISRLKEGSSGAYVRIVTAASITLEPGKVYKLTFKAKTEERSTIGDDFNIRMNNAQGSLDGETYGSACVGITCQNDGNWSEQTYYFKATAAANTIDMRFMRYFENIVLDNFELYEVDESLAVVEGASNLITNGDFDNTPDIIPPSEVTGVSVLNFDSVAEISWTNPTDSDFKAVYVYYITQGNEMLLGTATEGNYTLSNLENGVTHNLIIKTVDAMGNTSDGVTTALQPIADPVKYTSPVFSIDDVDADNISNGTLKASMQFKNNRMSEDYSVELILVLLKDGALIDIKSSYAIVSPSDEHRPYTELSVEINVPEGDGYSAELYVWDSITGMEAVTDSANLT